jgi:hypothetical protein
LTVLPTVFALVQGKTGRESASLDPDDPASPHYHEEELDEEKTFHAETQSSAELRRERQGEELRAGMQDVATWEN